MTQTDDLTGAEAICATLADCGVTACFANPGTSEMHLVTALGKETRIRSVLCLFEGVASGAADGFARMAGKPAMTLLHLGPGYTNAAANIHNARRAHTPMVNVIGDHALGHRKLDAPLASDIAGLAGPNSRWLKSVDELGDAGSLAVEAFAASFGPPAGPVSLVLPADMAWTRGAATAKPQASVALTRASDATINDAASAIRAAKRPALLVNGTALMDEGLAACARLEAAGIKVWCDTFITRQQRGGDRFAPARLPYFAEVAIKELGETDLLLLAGAKAPVAFFAYPDTPGELTPTTARSLSLGGPGTDSADALTRLADMLDARNAAPAPVAQPQSPTTKFNAHTIGQAIARAMPDETIICDDGVTAGLPIYLATAHRRHDWLCQTGGAIGDGIPLAVGAAVACPDRKVIALSGDGAGLYTVQALWTLARETLDVVTLVFVNHAYKILRIELQRTGANAAEGQSAPAVDAMLGLGNPEIDWVKVSEGFGVPAEAVSDIAGLDEALARAMAGRGPRLIACLMPGG